MNPSNSDLKIEIPLFSHLGDPRPNSLNLSPSTMNIDFNLHRPYRVVKCTHEVFFRGDFAHSLYVTDQ